MSCAVRNKKDIQSINYGRAVNAVLHYLDTVNPKIHYNYGPPYKVKNTLSIDTMSCLYYKCNAYYYYLYIDSNSMTIFNSIDKKKTYDFDSVRKLVDKEWNLSSDTLDYSVQVKILSNKDKIVFGTKNQYSKLPEGTFLFSPLIPMRENDNYRIWMKITHYPDPPFYEFYLRKKGDSYEVKGHEYDNNCDWGYSEDYIKKLCGK